MKKARFVVSGFSFLFVVITIAMSVSAFEVVGVAVIGLLFCAVCLSALLVIAKVFENKFRLIVSLLGCCAIIVSVIATQWPLRVVFAVMQPSFDRVSGDLKAEVSPSMPRNAGLFSIKKAEVYGDVTCLWIDLNPGGRTGFVQCGKRKAESTFNLWSMATMGDNWQFISED